MRLVPESLNEVFSFERSTSDPLKNLSVGKKVQIVKWLDSYEIKNYTINDDLTIDVNGDVDLGSQSLTCFPSFIKFNKVSGSFSCHNNQLTSLNGCPRTVGYSFYCASNQLTSLEGCPAIVGDSFYCHNNQLTSLEGCPRTVGANFSCRNNYLISLEGCPAIVCGDFYCSSNQLTSLEGCPATVGGSFYCRYNNKKFSKKDVRSLCKVKGYISV